MQMLQKLLVDLFHHREGLVYLKPLNALEAVESTVKGKKKYCSYSEPTLKLFKQGMSVF